MVGGVYLFTLGMLVYSVERYQTAHLMAGFGLLFGLYLLLLWGAKEISLMPLLILGAVARLLLIPAIPSLSDDFYRFLWDGHLLLEGLHPFSHTPEWYMQKGAPVVQGLTPELYESLNSKSYFTIYPPLAQGLFVLAAGIGGTDLLTGVIVLRIPILLAEAGTIWLMLVLLKRYRLPQSRVLLYALNPLVILELVGNLHLEAFAIFFLMLLMWAVSGLTKFRMQPDGSVSKAARRNSNWTMNSRKSIWAAIAFAGAVASKLWPLLLGPYLLLKMGWKKSWLWLLLSAVLLLLLFAPVFGEPLLEGMQNSLSLYYQRFEFNASLYYVLRALGLWVLGFNPIQQVGPLLALLATGLILYYSWKAKVWGWSTAKTLMLLYGLFLLCATTVHPWYVLPLVALMPLTNFRFPLFWSGLAFLTYAGYTAKGYTEPLALVALEYVLVFAVLIWEVGKLKTKSDKLSVSVGEKAKVSI